MSTLWKVLVGALCVSHIGTTYLMTKQVQFLSANAVCQEAKLALSYQLLMAIASNQIPSETVDVDSACAERNSFLKEGEETSQVSE
jgi:hypothetical protein